MRRWRWTTSAWCSTANGHARGLALPLLLGRQDINGYPSSVVTIATERLLDVEPAHRGIVTRGAGGRARLRSAEYIKGATAGMDAIDVTLRSGVAHEQGDVLPCAPATAGDEGEARPGGRGEASISRPAASRYRRSCTSGAWR